jgi:hypothetical protein
MWGCGPNLSCSGQGPVLSSCEYSNEPSYPIKSGILFDQLIDYHLLDKDSAVIS